MMRLTADEIQAARELARIVMRRRHTGTEADVLARMVVMLCDELELRMKGVNDRE
jgi:hypothetical protein